jgi:excisionase family DNA binding protein
MEKERIVEPLMTSDEIASLLRVDVVTIRRLVSRGELPAYRVGSEYRFTETDLADYLQRQRVSSGDEAGSRSTADPGALPWYKAWFGKGGGDQDRFERFNDPARRVLRVAHEEAQRLNHNFIGTEHLLLGLLREDEGVAAHVLRRLNVKLDAARERVEFIVGKGDRSVTGKVSLTGRTKKAIELAVEEARSLRHKYVGPEHLLLGLVREGEGVAAHVLQKLGADLPSVRAETIEVLHSEVKASPPPPIPEQAASLLAEGEQGLTCSYCGACCPIYFCYCFNCGTLLGREGS